MPNDRHNVKMIYASKPGGESIYLEDHWKDEDRIRIGGDSDSLDKNGDEFELDDNSKVRLSMTTSEGYSDSRCEDDHGRCADQGFMMHKKDFRDQEITFYFKLESSSSDDEVTPYCRGGAHNDSNDGCLGFAYKAQLSFAGELRLRKEQWHVSYVSRDWTDDLNIGDIEDKWIGIKFITYNLTNDRVKLEQWIDKDNNNKWAKGNDYTDDGGWGNSGGHCNGKKDQVGTWGGPLSVLRWDSVNNAVFKFASVREIDPSRDFDGTDTGGEFPDDDPGNEPDPNPNPAEQEVLFLSLNQTHLYNVIIDKSAGCGV